MSVDLNAMVDHLLVRRRSKIRVLSSSQSKLFIPPFDGAVTKATRPATLIRESLESSVIRSWYQPENLRVENNLQRTRFCEK